VADKEKTVNERLAHTLRLIFRLEQRHTSLEKQMEQLEQEKACQPATAKTVTDQIKYLGQRLIEVAKEEKTIEKRVQFESRALREELEGQIREVTSHDKRQ